jgi:hypothetical protein
MSKSADADQITANIKEIFSYYKETDHGYSPPENISNIPTSTRPIEPGSVEPKAGGDVGGTLRRTAVP